MRRITVYILIIFLLVGCSSREDCLSKAMRLRQRLVDSDQCSFTATVMADYTDQLYIFCMRCVVDKSGELSFEVIEPESIAGITGTISNTQSSLTFDDTVLAFSPLADGYISPVCAPWVFIQSLRSGYIHSCEKTGKGIFLSIDDSYQSEALQVDIQLDAQHLPVWADLLYKGRRVISITVEEFTIQ